MGRAVKGEGRGRGREEERGDRAKIGFASPTFAKKFPASGRRGKAPPPNLPISTFYLHLAANQSLNNTLAPLEMSYKLQKTSIKADSSTQKTCSKTHVRASSKNQNFPGVEIPDPRPKGRRV